MSRRVTNVRNRNLQFFRKFTQLDEKKQEHALLSGAVVPIRSEEEMEAAGLALSHHVRVGDVILLKGTFLLQYN